MTSLGTAAAYPSKIWGGLEGIFRVSLGGNLGKDREGAVPFPKLSPLSKMGPTNSFGMGAELWGQSCFYPLKILEPQVTESRNVLSGKGPQG